MLFAREGELQRLRTQRASTEIQQLMTSSP